MLDRRPHPVECRFPDARDVPRRTCRQQRDAREWFEVRGRRAFSSRASSARFVMSSRSGGVSLAQAKAEERGGTARRDGPERESAGASEHGRTQVAGGTASARSHRFTAHARARGAPEGWWIWWLRWISFCHSLGDVSDRGYSGSSYCIDQKQIHFKHLGSSTQPIHRAAELDAHAVARDLDECGRDDRRS